MNSMVKKPWFKIAFIEILVCCFPLGVFTFISLAKRDFSLMFSSFILLMILFAGYILFKNYQFVSKSRK